MCTRMNVALISRSGIIYTSYRSESLLNSAGSSIVFPVLFKRFGHAKCIFTQRIFKLVKLIRNIKRKTILLWAPSWHLLSRLMQSKSYPGLVNSIIYPCRTMETRSSSVLTTTSHFSRVHIVTRSHKTVHSVFLNQ